MLLRNRTHPAESDETVGAPAQEKRHIDRLRFVFLCTAVVVGIVVWRYLGLMLFHTSPDESQTAQAVERGAILDRNGRILAASIIQNSVTAWMPDVTDPAKTAELLGSILDIPDNQLRDRFVSHAGFLYVKRAISDSQSKQIEKLILGGALRGIGLEPSSVRVYPEGELAGHAIGYVNTDNVGLGGIEYSMDEWLSSGEPAGPDEKFGNQVVSTIDLNIQYFASESAKSVYEQSDADTVMLLVMDAKTGEFLAYVSVPEFDPNRY